MTVAVIGGGVAGLTAAWCLREGGDRVAVFEAGERLGGQIHTRRDGGVILEDGAEGWAAGSVAVAALCRRLGLEDDVLGQATTRALVAEAGGFRDIASDQAARRLGIQASEEDAGRGLVTLAGGMSSLVERLGAVLHDDVFLARGVREISTHRAGWVVHEHTGAGHLVDRVVMALPAAAAATLVSPVDAAAGALLRSIPAVSSVSVNLVLPRKAVAHALDASSVILADQGDDHVRACSLWSAKFPGRAPVDTAVLRAFVRPSAPAMERDDAWWAERALTDLGPVLGLGVAPDRVAVYRWPNALSRFPAGLPESLDRCRERLAPTGLWLVGGALVPGGVDGAVRSALAACERPV